MNGRNLEARPELDAEPNRQLAAQYPPRVRNKGRWSYQEHDTFVNCLKKYGKNWDIIEEMVPTRSSIQIRSHCQKYLNQIKKDYQTDDPMGCVLKNM